MTGRTVRTSRGVLTVATGPGLLAGVTDGPGLPAHRQRHGAAPRIGTEDLLALCAAIALAGRGGAGFPLYRKLQTVLAGRGRPVVVVNIAEGEPASHKDSALVLTSPHLVLDGAATVAAALGAREVHLVVRGDAPEVAAGVRRALDERGAAGERQSRLRWWVRATEESFVAGQSSAVLELLAGRPNLPTTSWQPAAVAGHRGRPTLLANTETFAQVALAALHGADALRAHGTRIEPGTTLLTLDGDGHAPSVVEVAHGTPWREVLHDRTRVPVLLGGYHGTWAGQGALLDATVSRSDLRARGLSLGAGVVLPLERGCPVTRTAEITAYLAGQSAGRCGPCRNGLPTLARQVRALSRGQDAGDEVARLATLVDGRGACAHPDGTAGLVRSMLAAFPEELDAHRSGHCSFTSVARREVGA